MELGESVSVDILVEPRHEEDTCAFCQATEPPKEMENDLTDHLDEDEEAEFGDATPEYPFKNDAGKLGTAMGGKPSPKKIEFKTVASGTLQYESSVAAHHLIPGNASLKESKLYKSKKFLWKDGMAKGNIGYDINNSMNGVWSPGNYAARPWGPKGTGFEAENELQVTASDYASACMDKWRCQFHDAHPAYSDFVMRGLNKLHEKLKAKEDIFCPEAKKKQDEERDPEKDKPLYAINARLHTMSSRMKKMLTFPTTNWKPNIYTSSFVETYVREKSHRDIPYEGDK